MVLMFGVQWFCSPIPIEFVHNCSSTSHLNVSFVYVCVCAVNAVLKSRVIQIVNVACWLSVLFYRLHYVDMSSLVTCTGVEVMLDVSFSY